MCQDRINWLNWSLVTLVMLLLSLILDIQVEGCVSSGLFQSPHLTLLLKLGLDVHLASFSHILS